MDNPRNFERLPFMSERLTIRIELPSSGRSGRLVLGDGFSVFVFNVRLGIRKRFEPAIDYQRHQYFALTLVLWPVAALVRRHYGHKLSLNPQQSRLRIMVRLVCLLDLAFVGALAAFFTMSDKDVGILSPRLIPSCGLFRSWAGWVSWVL